MGIKIKTLTSSDRKGFQLNIDSLFFNDRESVAIIGANGSGKTTLIESILGLTQTVNRELTILNKDNSSFDKNPEEKKNIGVQLQNSQFNQEMTVSELYQFHSLLYEQHSLEILNLFKVKELFKTRYSRLSRGQKQRVDLYLALAHEPKLLFLDEPGTGLDAEFTKVLIDILIKMKEQGVTIIMASHAESEISACEKILWMESGTVKAFGYSQQVINDALGKYKLDLTCQDNDTFDDVLILVESVTKVVNINRNMNTGTLFLDANVLEHIICKFNTSDFLKIGISECEISDLIKFKLAENTLDV